MKMIYWNNDIIISYSILIKSREIYWIFRNDCT